MAQGYRVYLTCSIADRRLNRTRSFILPSRLFMIEVYTRLIVNSWRQTSRQEGLAPWRSGIAPESIGGVYGHNAMGSNPNASPPV